ncbi:MAG: hypothetical protein U0232_15870 [Thermomicrobiales bacterium]
MIEDDAAATAGWSRRWRMRRRSSWRDRTDIGRGIAAGRPLRGAGHAIPTEGCLEAMALAARNARVLLLEPVYTGKMLAG